MRRPSPLRNLTVLVVCIMLAVEGIPELRDRIKHVIVLMEENRSFDHIFGFYTPPANSTSRGVDGLTGNEFNYASCTNYTSEKVFVQNGTIYVNICDPSHTTPATTYKIFGPQQIAAQNLSDPWMGCFAAYENLNNGPGADSCGVMNMFHTRSQLPVMAALADNFVVCDKFFASVPGSTWPNRLFMLSATSMGATDTCDWYLNINGWLFPQKTIFDQVAEAGGRWAVYYDDTPWELYIGTLAHHPEHLHDITQFMKDAASGNLPDFAFINPRSGINMTEGVGSNDQHPDHDMALGERYYKRIYEALRAGPAWNETLFIVTYDEHGGFYDHVPTPLEVPPPGDDEPPYTNIFHFDRLGIRIPTVLVSPWLPKGAVLSEPPEKQKPEPHSRYDLTSILATTRKLLRRLENATALTDRDAWAGTFEHLFGILDEPRVDAPMTLPEAPPATFDPSIEASLPVNSLQHHILGVHAHLNEKPHPHPAEVQSQGQVGDWVSHHFQSHRERTRAWKESKQRKSRSALSQSGEQNSTVDLELIIQVMYDPCVTDSWTVSRDDGSHSEFLRRNGHQERIHGRLPKPVPWETIWTNITEPMLNGSPSNSTAKPGVYCWDCGDCRAQSNVSISLCYPSWNPATNRDPSQQWVFYPDSTFRPFLNQSLCLTNSLFQSKSYTLFLQECIPDHLQQHYAWHGPAAGNSGDGRIYFSDCTTAIEVTLGSPQGPPPY